MLERAYWTLPACVFFLLHASYAGWHGGAGYSARFLVPMLPVLVYWIWRRKPSGRLFGLSVAYSLLFNALAGFLPILTFDQTPWQVLAKIWREIGF